MQGKFLFWSVIVRHRHHAFEITSFSCLRRPVVVVRHRRQILDCAMRVERGGRIEIARNLRLRRLF